MREESGCRFWRYHAGFLASEDADHVEKYHQIVIKRKDVKVWQKRRKGQECCKERKKEGRCSCVYFDDENSAEEGNVECQQEFEEDSLKEKWDALVTDLVPSEMACLESSPGRISRTEVWISREEMVDFLLYEASLEASEAMRCTTNKGRGKGAKSARRFFREGTQGRKA
jgi:hypothetical protein